MQTHLLRLTLAGTLALCPAMTAAQVVEQTIRIGGAGDAGIQLPMFGGPQRQFKTGTGRIRGRVIASDGSGPIRRAQVRISGPDVAPKGALTDAEGRFEFRDLPAGRFSLQASKSGFVSVQYGQTRPFEQGKPIELSDKQMLDGADIGMPRGGVIAGRIVDEYGDAVPDVGVTAMRQSWSNGRRRLTPAPGRIAQTNDLGQYRIYGLPPGDYVVSASLRGGGMDMIELEVMAAAGATGPTTNAPRSGYASTFYPGTPNAAEAQRISVASGQDVASADFSLVAVKLARVSGIVLGSDGKPTEGAMVNLASSTRDANPLFLGGNGARTGKDGSFTVNSVAPGDYILQVRRMQVFTSSQGDNMMVFRATAMGAAGGDAEFGSLPLTVAGDDVANVVLVTARGATATGQMTFDGAKPPAMTNIQVTSVPIDGDGPIGPAVGSLATNRLKEDGSFELKGMAGPGLIRVGSAPPGWTVRSVRLNGNDVTDTGIDFKPGETVSGLEIELTPRSATVAGAVTANDGTRLKDYTVVIFSESPEHWRLPMTRWVTGTRPDQEGRFKVQHLPAGRYYAVAVDYLPTGEWGDPEILDRLKAKAKRFTLAEGGSETLDLKLAGEY
jgi:hypothetical protein